MKRFAAIFFLLLPFNVSSYYMKIGILSNEYDTMKIGKVWSMGQNYSGLSLEPQVEQTQWWSSLDATGMARAICSLVKNGADALVFLGPPRWNPLVSSYSDHLGLPFVSALDHGESFGKCGVSMLPDTSEAAADFMVHYNWDKFVFIYDSGNGADQIQKILRSASSANFVPEIEAFWKASDSDQAFRFINELLRPTVKRKIVLATSEQFADQLVLKLARRNNFSILLLTPVGTIQRLSSHGFYSITKFSVVDERDKVLVALENRLKTLPAHFARGRPGKDVPDSVILHYDSSLTLNTMFYQIARETPALLRSRPNIDCLEFSGEVPETSKKTDYLKKVLVAHGATGKIQFDDDGRRTDYKLNIIQSTPFDVQKIGAWSSVQGLQLLPEHSTRPQSAAPSYAAYRNDPPVKVTSVISPPFLIQNPDGSFRGFVFDFLEELFHEIGLTYQLELVKDGGYGRIKNGEWTGMIGELIRGEADIAVAPLTKTIERMKVVDFSKNIMTTGLNILMKKETPEDAATFSPFSFITVWSPETWVVVVVVAAVYSAGGYAIARFIGAPDRVRALESKGTDNLSPCGSVWFTLGALFCRDTGIYPRNLTHRLWTLLWWIFCLFISLLYVAMLTSSLVTVRSSVTTTYSRKTSQQIMKESLDTGRPLLGLVGGGSTMNFFLTSEIGIYEEYGRFLQQNPQLMVSSYAEGLKKVREMDGGYAMIVESALGKLLADTEPCDTVVTSGYLNTQPYAIALPKNSTLKDIVDHGVLSIMETGRLRNMYEKWWHNETTTCEDPTLNVLPKVYNTSMTLHEVSGLFYLFIMFILLSVAGAAVEYYIRTRNITMR